MSRTLFPVLSKATLAIILTSISISLRLIFIELMLQAKIIKFRLIFFNLG